MRVRQQPQSQQSTDGPQKRSSNTPVSPSGPSVERSRGHNKHVTLHMGDLPIANAGDDDGDHHLHDNDMNVNGNGHSSYYPYSATLDGTGGLRPLPGRPRRKRHGRRSKYHHSSSSSQSFGKRFYARWFKGFASSFSSLFVAVALWYFLGVIAIGTSKLLLTHFSAALPPLSLTLQQLLIGTTLLRFLLQIRFLNSPGIMPCPTNGGHSSSPSRRWSYVSPPPSAHRSPVTRFLEQITGGKLIEYRLLAAGIFFSMGFLTTNYAFAGSSASFVETIKASEPITSATVATMWQIEVLGRNEIISLGTIVAGVLLSTLGNGLHKDSSTMAPSSTLQESLRTCVVVTIANLCFSFRGLYQKLFHADPNTAMLDDLNLQLRIQQVGVAMLIIPAILLEGPTVVMYWWHHATRSSVMRYLILAVLNGICFTSYNLASTYILTRISVVHHAALNCLRRVFAIVVTSIYFVVPMTFLGMLGIFLSTAGFLSFTHYKVQRQRQPKPLSSLLPVSVNNPPGS